MRIISSRVLRTTLKFPSGVGLGNISEDDPGLDPLRR